MVFFDKKNCVNTRPSSDFSRCHTKSPSQFHCVVTLKSGGDPINFAHGRTPPHHFRSGGGCSNFVGISFLLTLIFPKQIELDTSSWAHFKEQTKLFIAAKALHGQRYPMPLC